MLLLSLDTSTFQGSAALIKDDQVLDEKISLHQKAHTEFMNVAIDEMLKSHRLSLQDLNAIACGQGPGSFTGIRVATNIAKTLSYSLQIPIYSADTLMTLAQQSAKQFPKFSQIASLVNAHKNLVYFNLFSSKEGLVTPLFNPKALSISEIDSLVQNEVLAVGDAYEEFSKAWTPSLKTRFVRLAGLSDYPKASDLGLWVVANHKKLKSDDWKSFLPLYIRASEAEERIKISE
ncbi:MAG: tRNA (adenosine(37)-N6)-threonylcarbamoyltransferase complex dimerization subunit type 1 TsaB [Pseudobdellovibrionaceae bacterium]